MKWTFDHMVWSRFDVYFLLHIFKIVSCKIKGHGENERKNEKRSYCEKRFTLLTKLTKLFSNSKNRTNNEEDEKRN
jgi:hypothetical protein